MNKPSPLARLHELLSALGYASHFLAHEPESPCERLLIRLSASSSESPELLQVFFMEDLLEQPADTGPSMLSFTVSWESLTLAKLSPARQLEALKLLTLCNKLLPLGALGIEHQSENLYFNYNLLAEDQNRNAALVSEIIDMLSFYLPQIQALFVSLLSGNRPLKVILEQSHLMTLFRKSAGP
jgi:hypothetical protein